MWDTDKINHANTTFSDGSPADIIAHALELAGDRAVVSTNFRPHEAVILHLVTQQRPDIPVLWADHGYNTSATYQCAEQIIAQLSIAQQVLDFFRTWTEGAGHGRRTF